MQFNQKPKYQLIPSGEHIMFTAYDAKVLTKYKFKYVAYLYVSDQSSTWASNKIGTLKASPNVKGVGIFDFSSIVDNYVSPDYEGGKVLINSGSNYSKCDLQPFTTRYHDIHRVDKFSTARNSIRWFKVMIFCEYAESITAPVLQFQDSAHAETSVDYLVYNGVLNESDILIEDSADLGYNLDHHGLILNDTVGKFLTNSPTLQYIRDYDYHTLAFFSNYDTDFVVGNAGATNPGLNHINTQFYYNGATAGSLLQSQCLAGGGGYNASSDESSTKMIFAGVGVGNLRGNGYTVPTNWDSYLVFATDDIGEQISQVYQFIKQDIDADGNVDCKGYETIRLTWLNKFGAWDYYNFTKKSSRTFSKEGSTYEQQSGTWNEDTFAIRGYKGGSRSFGSKVSETITINTDWITEDEAVWMEELFISSDVFIIDRSSTYNANQGDIRKFTSPVLVSSTEHARKTKTNDGLIQYTFEIKRSINRKTHRR